MYPIIFRFRYCVLILIQLLVVLCAYAQVNTEGKRIPHPDSRYSDGILLNKPLEGFSGIWYANQPSDDEFVYKYSGGLGTYTANHNPLAIYSAEVNKTFFCYGGVNEKGSLIHSVSYFDHKYNRVARPIGVIDKQTTDAHDNPVISLDSNGYIWLFSTSHGVSRLSYIHRSINPYDISEFEEVQAFKLENGKQVPLDNFSYLQVYYDPAKGFTGLFTHYVQKDLKHGKKTSRVISWMTSRDGVLWSEWKDMASIEEGHYQTSVFANGKIGTTFNYHPNLKDRPGLNYRTNIYYLEYSQINNSWQTVNGRHVNVPLTEIDNTALAADYVSEELNVYINDIAFDAKGYPAVLYVTSKGYEAGPVNGPRRWNIAHWNVSGWDIKYVTASDNNYDMGSLYIEEDGKWIIVGPTEPGPQPYNTGGEMALWESNNSGASWNKIKQLTTNSKYNHSYARKPLNANPGFYSLWADGHGRKPSDSRIYFATRDGKVYRLPVKMKKDFMRLNQMRLE